MWNILNLPKLAPGCRHSCLGAWQRTSSCKGRFRRCPRSTAWLARGEITLGIPIGGPDVRCPRLAAAQHCRRDPKPTLTRTGFAAVMEPSASPGGGADLSLSQFGTRTDHAGRGNRRKPLEYLSNATAKLKEAQVAQKLPTRHAPAPLDIPHSSGPSSRQGSESALSPFNPAAMEPTRIPKPFWRYGT